MNNIVFYLLLSTLIACTTFLDNHQNKGKCEKKYNDQKFYLKDKQQNKLKYLNFSEEDLLKLHS